MKIYGTERDIDIQGFGKFPKDVRQHILNITKNLDINYKINRNIFYEDGGYCFGVENEEDIINLFLLTGIRIGITPEENNTLICRKNWHKIEYLVNNETLITVFIRNKFYDLCAPFWKEVYKLLKKDSSYSYHDIIKELKNEYTVIFLKKFVMNVFNTLII